MAVFGIDFFYIACVIVALAVLFVAFLLWKAVTGDPGKR